MIRQCLLVEALIKRRMSRLGDIYMFRKPFGPPSDEDMDRWLHQTTQNFDFTPLFSGDQDQARIVSHHFVEYLKKATREEGKDWEQVRERLRTRSPFLRRGFRTFFAYYDAKIKS